MVAGWVSRQIATKMAVPSTAAAAGARIAAVAGRIPSQIAATRAMRSTTTWCSGSVDCRASVAAVATRIPSQIAAAVAVPSTAAGAGARVAAVAGRILRKIAATRAVPSTTT